MEKDDLIAIARVKAPNGLNGKMWISPYGEALNRYTHLLIDTDPTPKKLLSVEPRKHGVIIALEGITQISQVEQIVGATLSVRRAWLPELAEGEYYWNDLIGLQVVDLGGKELGRIVNIFRTGANDVYVVDETRQYYIPAIAAVVKEISLAKGLMIIDTDPIAEIL